MTRVTVNFPDSFLPKVESFAASANMPLEKAVVLLTRSALETVSSESADNQPEVELWPPDDEIKKNSTVSV